MRVGAPARSRAAVVLVTTGLVCALGLSAYDGVQQVRTYSSSSGVAAARSEFHGFNCLERRFHLNVPRNSVIFIPPAPSAFPQRLAEWAIGWARVVPRASQADLVVSVRWRRNGPCDTRDVVAGPSS